MNPSKTEFDGELLEMRSPTTKTYLLGLTHDGEEILKAVVKPVRVHWGPENEFGIDTVWARQQDGTYTLTGVPYEMTVGPGIAWTFTVDGESISGSMVIPEATKPVPKPVIRGVQLWWPGAALDFDVCLLPHAEHAETFCILHSAVAPRSFREEFTHGPSMGVGHGVGGMDNVASNALGRFNKDVNRELAIEVERTGDKTSTVLDISWSGIAYQRDASRRKSSTTDITYPVRIRA